MYQLMDLRTGEYLNVRSEFGIIPNYPYNFSNRGEAVDALLKLGYDCQFGDLFSSSVEKDPVIIKIVEVESEDPIYSANY